MDINSKSRLNYIKKNILFGYMHKFTLIILEFILRYFFIKILGKEILGLNEIFINIIQILSVAELGINSVVGYSLYEPLSKNDKLKIAKLVNFYKKAYYLIFLIILFVGILIIPFLNKIVNMRNINFFNVLLFYILVLLDTCISYLFIYKSILLEADQKRYIILKYEISFNIIRIFLQIISLIIYKNIYIYLIIKIIIRIIINLLISKYVDINYKYLKEYKKVKLPKKDVSEITKVIKSGLVYKISAILLNSTDNLLISMLVGTIWVGYIANYNTVIIGLASIYTIFFSSLTSSIGNMLFTTEIKKRKEVFEILIFVSNWLGIILAICFFILVNEFIDIWLGKGFTLSKNIVLMKSFLIMLSCSLQPLFCFREALGLYQKTKYIMLLSAIINIFLSIFMGHKWGVFGILGASIVSVLVTYFWYEPYILYKDYFKEKINRYFIERIYNFIVLILGLFLFNMLNNYCLFYSTSFFAWFIKGSIIFILVNIYCFILFYKKNNFYKMKEYLKQKLLKIKEIKS